MTDALAKFTVQMQISLKAMQHRMEALNLAAKTGADVAQREIRSQIIFLEEQAHKAEGMITKAGADVKAWADEPIATVAAWKANFDTHHLNARAERATRYAEAASEVAIASIAQAEQAKLDAKLAHAEAVAASAMKSKAV